MADRPRRSTEDLLREIDVELEADGVPLDDETVNRLRLEAVAAAERRRDAGRDRKTKR